MKKAIRLFLVFLLSATLMLMGPFSVFAEPAPPTTDPATILKPFNLTAALDAEATDSGFNGVREVTSIAVCPGLFYFIAAVDNDGKPFILESDGDSVADGFPADIADGFTHITDIAITYSDTTGSYVNDPGKGTGVSPDTPTLAIVGDIDGDPYLRVVDIDLNWFEVDLSTFGIESVTSVAGSMYGDSFPIGMTLGPSGFAMFDWSTVDVIKDKPLSDAANVVEAFLNIAFLTGSHDGRLLFAEPDTGEILLAADAGDVQSICMQIINLYNLQILAASMGEAGYARLFKSNLAEENFTEANVPRTMDTNVFVSASFNQALVAGTGGGAAHLYRWKPVAGEFINLDYMVAGMDRVNDIYSQFGGYFQSADKFAPMTEGLKGVFSGIKAQKGFVLPGNPAWMVGGAGAKKLVTVFEAEPDDLTPVPKGTGTSVDCDAGGASVVFPTGAVGVDYNVLLEKVASGTPTTPGGLSLLGSSYDFQCFDSAGVPITDFSQPVTITIHYDEADLGSLSEDSLQIFWHNPTSGVWEAVTPCVIDKVSNTITIQTTHFSQFAILGMTQLPYTGF